MKKIALLILCFGLFFSCATDEPKTNSQQGDPTDELPTDELPSDDGNNSSPPVSGPTSAPCESGLAGGFYPCSGYDLLYNISISEFDAQRGNDCWGWTDPDNGKEYALMGLNDGTAFIDISDPSAPVYLGKLETETTESSWRDIKVYQNHAYIVAEATNHGMQVFDLTRLRNATGTGNDFDADNVYTGFGSAHNLVINEESGYAYGVGTQTYGGGPHFINLQDPANPVAAGGYGMSSYSHDAQVITYNGPDTEHVGKEILIGSNGNGIVIVDITNKNNPVKLADIDYDQTQYTHQGWFTEDHTYFLVGDELDEPAFGFNTRTLVFDFSNLDNPQLKVEYFGPTPAIDHNGYVKGDTYYLANYTAGLRVIDIADIANGNLIEVGYFDTFNIFDSASFRGAWSVYPYFESGNIIISDINNGLFIVKKQ